MERPRCLSRDTRHSWYLRRELPITGIRGIECRTGGAAGDYQAVVTLPNAVAFNARFIGMATSPDMSLVKAQGSRRPDRPV